MFPPLHTEADLSLLLLRLALGAIFLAHGPGKLKGAMGGFMTFIGAAETLGAVALITGLLTPLASLGLAIIMMGAIWKKAITWHVPFADTSKNGWEFDVLILAACLVLISFGAGFYSLDAIWMPW